MKQVFSAAAIAVFLAFVGQTVWAQDFQKGLDAANAGEFETALQEWRPYPSLPPHWFELAC